MEVAINTDKSTSVSREVDGIPLPPLKNPLDKRVQAAVQIPTKKAEPVYQRALHVEADSSRRSDKDKVSQNGLQLLKKIVGRFSLEKPSDDLRKLPKSGQAMDVYTRFFSARSKDPSFRTSYAEWKQQVAEIQELINRTPTQLSDCNTHRKQIQKLINTALCHPIYQELKTHEFNPLVHFLHTTADILHNRTEGMSVFHALGERLIGKIAEGEHNYAEVGQMLDKARNNSSASSVDKWYNRLFTHSIFHWKRTHATAISRQESSLETYNAYDTGNYNAELGVFQIDGISIRTSAGPNPSNPSYQIFPAMNQRNENLARLLDVSAGTGPSHYQVILEGGEKSKGPKARRNSVLNDIEKFPNQYSAMALPLDGEAWKGTGAFKNIKTAKDFIKALSCNMEEVGFRDIKTGKFDNGFVIPQKMLTDRMIREANASFIEAFQWLEGTKTWADLAQKGQLSRTLLLAYDAILSLKAMVSVAKSQSEALKKQPLILANIDSLQNNITFNFACKQGIDRGVILNMILRFLADAKSKGKFTATSSEIYQYGGYTAGRARMVEARKIQWDRYKALRNFVSLMAEASPVQQELFLAQLHLPEIRFIPSHILH